MAFLYLNGVWNFSGIELCREQQQQKIFGSRENQLTVFFAIDFLAFFNNADFHI